MPGCKAKRQQCKPIAYIFARFVMLGVSSLSAVDSVFLLLQPTVRPQPIIRLSIGLSWAELNRPCVCLYVFVYVPFACVVLLPRCSLSRPVFLFTIQWPRFCCAVSAFPMRFSLFPWWPGAVLPVVHVVRCLLFQQYWIRRKSRFEKFILFTFSLEQLLKFVRLK